jgi:hypothetical protein
METSTIWCRNKKPVITSWRYQRPGRSLPLGLTRRQAASGEVADPPAPDVPADRAVATGDEHAIKLTEACLRLYADSPEPVLLHAAARGRELLV